MFELGQKIENHGVSATVLGVEPLMLEFDEVIEGHFLGTHIQAGDVCIFEKVYDVGSMKNWQMLKAYDRHEGGYDVIVQLDEDDGTIIFDLDG